MQGSDIHDSRALGAGLVIVGAVLATAAIVTAFAAADHMTATSLCGPLTRHCLLCVVSAASLLASAGVIGAGVLLRCGPRLNQARPGRT